MKGKNQAIIDSSGIHFQVLYCRLFSIPKIPKISVTIYTNYPTAFLLLRLRASQEIYS